MFSTPIAAIGIRLRPMSIAVLLRYMHFQWGTSKHNGNGGQTRQLDEM